MTRLNDIECAMKAAIGRWPKCRTCKVEYLLGQHGLICDCPGIHLISVVRKFRTAGQISLTSLRRMFPKKCLN